MAARPEGAGFEEAVVGPQAVDHQAQSVREIIGAKLLSPLFLPNEEHIPLRFDYLFACRGFRSLQRGSSFNGDRIRRWR